MNDRRQRQLKTGLTIKEEPRKAEATPEQCIPDRTSQQTQKKQAEKTKKRQQPRNQQRFLNRLARVKAY